MTINYVFGKTDKINECLVIARVTAIWEVEIDFLLGVLNGGKDRKVT